MSDLILIRARNNPTNRIRRGLSSNQGGMKIPPYSILSLDSYVERAGFSVTLIDRFKPDLLNLPAEVIAGRVIRESPSLVGISALTSQSADAIALARAIKNISPVPVVFGGAHFSALPDQALNYADSVVIGEGEKTLVGLLKGRPYSEKEVIRGEPITEAEMDSIPFFTREKMSRTAFSPRMTGEYAVLTARGCPFNCVFCKDTSRSSPLRYHSAEYVVDMLAFAHREFGFTRFFIMDDVFACSMERLEAIADGLSRKRLDFTFTCFLHANVVRVDLLKMLKRIGIKWISIGVESGNDAILNLIHKNTTTEKLRSAVAMCKSQGFMVNALFMLGNIGETVTTMRDTIRYSYSLQSDHDWFSYANPFPGTRFYTLVPEYGTIIEPDFSKWNNQEIIYLPNGIEKGQLRHLMIVAQIERVIKILRSYGRRLGSFLKTRRQ